MKKIIDEHGRVFGKVSIIDFLVILIVVVVGVALYLRYDVLNPTDSAAETGSITYTIKIYGVRDYTANALKAGDALFDKNNSGGYSIGTITDIAVSDAKKISETVDGKLVLGNYAAHYDVTVTVTAHGALSGGRYLVNKTYELNTNSNRTFLTKFCTFEATIMEIE
ncbi:protein of unknown function [Sporobacter termitidis DSM 10068]|uniref:DUF4330 domain-containing protein n=1 Tax=Sporobacter termitidis DSM 10068 TaxID=1123282 RepID=A0A1M5WWS2_9FIRM|nr:DUF4330 domain-containing protein [Sporobacter termitidis]SHH92096.1 protein of unknown function [Sporobacter termitidis DSM 10068]